VSINNGDGDEEEMQVKTFLQSSSCENNGSNKVELISKVKDTYSLDDWYEFADETHFWFKWRLDALLKLIIDNKILVDQSLRALDIGVGNGILRSQIEQVTQWIVDGADINLGALYQNPICKGRTLYYDIVDELPEFANFYDIIFLFDVIEHLGEPSIFLKSAINHLKIGGFLFINVPSLPSLFSSFDTAMGHFRRYNLRSLAASVKMLPLEIKDIRYWGALLVPLLIIRKLLDSIFHSKRKIIPKKEIIQWSMRRPSDILNQIFLNLMKLELTLPTRLPIGSSLLMACKKISKVGERQ